MFRDAAQRIRVFARLLEADMLPEGTFTAEGPCARANLSAALDPHQQRLQRVALAIWSGSGSLPLGDVIALEEPFREAFGSLLMAIGLGQTAIDRWLEESFVSDG
jgi:hypothetical protein